MRRRSRTRRLLKWVGLVGCVVIVAAGIVSLWWTFGYRHLGPHEAGTCFTGVQIRGVCVIVSRSYDYPGRVTRSTGKWYFGRFDPSLYFRDNADGLLFGYRVHYGGFTVTAFPLLPAVIVVGVPTAILWCRDRRPPKGHCQNCGYNLTGNVTGICPECGRAI